MEIARTFFIAGANPETPLTGSDDVQFPEFTKATEASIIRDQDHLVVVDVNEHAKKTDSEIQFET